MRLSRLVLRGLTYYWRTNVAVVIGVATAVAVLGGALVVGDSVRGSLRDLVLQRLGRADLVVVSTAFVREALADDLRGDETFEASFASICPMVGVQGTVTDQAGGRRVLRALVYGVDDRFWRFHDIATSQDSSARDAVVSAAVASDLAVTAGDAVLVRVERPSAAPLESLHGRKEDRGRSLRLTVRRVVGPADLGEFSLQPRQDQVRAVFVPLRRLQQELDVESRVNTLLVSRRLEPSNPTASVPAATLAEIVRRRATLDDLALTLRPIESFGVLALESPSGVLDPSRVEAANQAAAAVAMRTQPIFTYLANSLRRGDREVPYSLVTAMDLRSITPQVRPVLPSGAEGPPPMVLNDWAARDLGARVGDPLTLEYYVWDEPGRLLTRTTDFQVVAIVPLEGAAKDRDLAPVYRGITEALTLGDWDPPFPVDLRRVRRNDEQYWERYRTTPKAFIPYEVGQKLWRSRYGDRTSVRITPGAGQPLGEALAVYRARLRATIDPLALGLSVRDVRADGLAASRGATDFGEYFTYFSFFLVLSALLLAALFFRLGVEQRAREVGLLRSLGYTPRLIRRLFACEALLVAAIGSLVGVAGAVGYAFLMMKGLGSWWSGAVGTHALRLHVSATSLAVGAFGAVAAATACIWWTLRALSRLSERSLLAGRVTAEPSNVPGRLGAAWHLVVGALLFGTLGLALVVMAGVRAVDKTGAFFGAGSALLVACLCGIGLELRRAPHRPMERPGWWSVSRLGIRNAAARPGRSVLVTAVIAAATFMLISVDAFRRVGPAASDRHSGVGGYPLLVELLLPLAYDPDSREGRETLGLEGKDVAAIEPFRLLPGDDASCLNLYEPRNPRILGARRAFIDSNRFAFQQSLASGEAERNNPWLLLTKEMADEGEPVVPVIADANSMTYVLHKALGDDILVQRSGRPVRLRLVAALADSIFQSELLMSDANFRRLFPDQGGYRVLLVETAPQHVADVAAAIEQRGGDIGAGVVFTADRLAEFHRVENTYISTFQTLGGLGLLLGTVGLAAVLLRNVLERRRDLALLGAVGFRKAHVVAVVLAENVMLLCWGLTIGTLCALVAIVPAVTERSGWHLIRPGGWLLLMAVLLAGLLSSVAATFLALRAPLLSALRAE